MASIVSAGTTSATALNMSADTSGVLQLASNNGTTAVTVDTSQNVGIGTSSPGLRLDVAGGDSSTFDQSISGGRSSNYAGSLLFKNSYWNSGAFGAAAIRGLDSGSSGGILAFYTTTNGGGTTGVPTERARIDNSGNVGIGLNSPSYKLDISGTTSIITRSNNTNNVSGDQNFRTILGSNCNNTSSYHWIGTTGATDRILVYGNGNIQNTNNSYGGISDVKLKENIVDATPKLTQLNQVRVVNYNLIGETTKQIGVIAQELEQIFPSMVDETHDLDAEGNDLGTTTKSVKYSVFVPMLIKAIQELKAEVDSLKAELTAIKGA